MRPVVPQSLGRIRRTAFCAAARCGQPRLVAVPVQVFLQMLGTEAFARALMRRRDSSFDACFLLYPGVAGGLRHPYYPVTETRDPVRYIEYSLRHHAP